MQIAGAHPKKFQGVLISVRAIQIQKEDSKKNIGLLFVNKNKSSFPNFLKLLASQGFIKVIIETIFYFGLCWIS